jgi:hypothetical protein
MEGSEVDVDKEPEMENVQAGAPEPPEMKLNNQEETKEGDTNGKEGRKKVALGTYALGSRCQD